MPWIPSDATTHDKSATGAKGVRWSATANAVLKRTGDDAQAIKIANAGLKKRTPLKMGMKRRGA